MSNKEVVRHQEGVWSPQLALAYLVKHFGTKSGEAFEVFIPGEELHGFEGVLETSTEEGKLGLRIAVTPQRREE